ncbi:unnamed protein product [Pleuronectes platessa]|uniref:Uncharacterized protein n=1 Tax=Pleuronectes platessa TaxID=8262 RepID=A0A9N7UHL6_PLEPL|nr:unnamed protein product [Pleuronectes platessa]
MCELCSGQVAVVITANQITLDISHIKHQTHRGREREQQQQKQRSQSCTPSLKFVISSGLHTELRSAADMEPRKCTGCVLIGVYLWATLCCQDLSEGFPS